MSIKGMAEFMGRCSALIFAIVLTCGGLTAAAQSRLFEHGYNVVPVPQKVEFKGGDFEIGNGWRLQLGQGVKPDDVAVESLKEGLWRRAMV